MKTQTIGNYKVPIRMESKTFLSVFLVNQKDILTALWDIHL